MLPSPDLQLQVAMKALTDTILPALDPAQKVAAEQLHLTVATLAMVRRRLPAMAAVDRRLLELAAAQARAVLACMASEALAAEAGQAETLLARVDPEPHAIGVATSRLKALVGDIARDPQTPAAVLRAVLATSQPSLDVARAWCLPGGFETEAEEIARLTALVAE